MLYGIFPIACDHCSHAIRSPEDGMLLWIMNAEGEATQAVIVHNCGGHPECVLPEGLSLEAIPLWETVGAGGLIMLCETLKASPRRASMIAEVIERLFVPGFDRARFLTVRWG